MEEKDKKLWIELYNIAEKIQKIEPWKYLWDMDLLSYLSPTYNDMFYCSVMGRAGMHKSMAIYQGEQIYGFMEMVENKIPDYMLMNYQECICCSFMSREETLKENRELIKQLGLKFRGTWVSFECFEKGYEPRPINIEQVKVMIEVLTNFYEMFKAIINKTYAPDFENQEILARYYDKDKEEYINVIERLTVPHKRQISMGIDKKELKKIFGNVDKKDFEIEYEFLNYLPVRIRDSKDENGNRYYPRIRMIAEHKSGYIFGNDMIDIKNYESERDYIEESVTLLLSFMKEIGIPKKIYVRDDDARVCIQNIMDALNIKVVIKSKLNAIDEALEYLLYRM